MGGGENRKEKRGVVSGLFTTVATCQTERRVLFGIGKGGKKGVGGGVVSWYSA